MSNYIFKRVIFIDVSVNINVDYAIESTKL